MEEIERFETGRDLQLDELRTEETLLLTTDVRGEEQTSVVVTMLVIAVREPTVDELTDETADVSRVCPGDEEIDDEENDRASSSSALELPPPDELGDKSTGGGAAVRPEANKVEYPHLDGGVEAGEIGRQLLLCILRIQSCTVLDQNDGNVNLTGSTKFHQKSPHKRFANKVHNSTGARVCTKIGKQKNQK